MGKSTCVFTEVENCLEKAGDGYGGSPGIRQRVFPWKGGRIISSP